MMNYETKELVYFEPKVDKFKLEKFAPLSMEIYNAIFRTLWRYVSRGT
jgi:DNA polymerase-3 subunit delta'